VGWPSGTSLPSSARGMLWRRPSQTGAPEAPPSRLTAACAELHQDVGELQQAQPGVGLGAAVGGDQHDLAPVSATAAWGRRPR
jgi:hypothetical protein